MRYVLHAIGWMMTSHAYTGIFTMDDFGNAVSLDAYYEQWEITLYN